MAQTSASAIKSYQIATLVEKIIESLGAHRKSGRRSLEYRLRDSSSIREHVVRLLAQLEEAVDDDEFNDLTLTDEAHDHLDLELIRYLEDDCESNKTDIDMGLANIGDIIDCLLRFSVAIRNPAPHDQFMSRAGEETLGYYEDFDIAHVREKFPRLEVELVQRLGRAMISRRQFLKYREGHYARISGGLDNDDCLADGGDQTTTASSIPVHDKDTLGGPPLTDLDTQSAASETSYAPSLGNDEEIRVPPIPEKDPSGTFLCPFCYLMISVSSRKDWKKHVFGDLQPYICLVPYCPTQDHKYSRRSDLAYHMKQVHWRSLQCPYGCQPKFEDTEVFRSHIQEMHAAILTQDQHYTLEQTSRKGNLKKAIGPCPLCLEVEISSARQYCDHIGYHLEQLALFALPQTIIEDSDSKSQVDAEEDSDSKSQVDVEEEDSGGGGSGGSGAFYCCNCRHGPWNMRIDGHCGNCQHQRCVNCEIKKLKRTRV
ncbi:hypothetical protein F5Y14DRAFT_444252 [Nemania sp. NC0429]|nr:hypothetical protein F5Y14DRAFT_444252 [Nemania sp. NC0429]